ncbi:hypothetical protein [Maribacter antarcticus]|uniref:hypothetical protein n=1 Tax=Maribacter antarcticus TaxID=505250 RepID=UPI00047BDA49|nr:hypothetical protein [Maribacter antarcticus]
MDKNPIIKGQIIKAENIQVFNVKRHLSKGQGFTSSNDIFLSVTDKGIQFEPTEWNSKATFVYGTIKKTNEDGKLRFDYKGEFMRSSSPDSAVSDIYECTLKADLDTINKICDVTMMLDSDSLIFQMNYQ